MQYLFSAAQQCRTMCLTKTKIDKDFFAEHSKKCF